MSISTKISMLVALLTTVILVAFGCVQYQQLRSSSNTRLQAQAEHIAMRLANGIEGALYDLNERDIGHILEAEMANSDVVGISVFDEIVTQDALYHEVPPAVFLGRIRINAQVVADKHLPTEFTHEHLDAVIHDHKPIGTVLVRLSDASLQTTLRQGVTRIAFEILIVDVLLIVALTLALRTLVSRPLGGVVSVLQAMAAGDTSRRLEVDRDDEIGGLSRSVNTTVDNMQQLLSVSQDALAAKSTFLSTMSHELRTPLNGVIGCADLLYGTPLDHLQREHVDTIRLCGESLLTVIGDILDFSKIEAGHLELEYLACDPLSIVEESLWLVAAKATQRGLSLSWTYEGEPPGMMGGDPTRLRQVLLNLLSNAVKFTDQGGISVVVTRRDETLRIAVSDTGIGITDEALAGLFSAFSQADASMNRRFGGTGLGLVISKRLIEIMGGSITVTSRVGHGSTFTIELPSHAICLMPSSRSVTAPLTGHELVHLRLTAEQPLAAMTLALIEAGCQVVDSLAAATVVISDQSRVVTACTLPQIALIPFDSTECPTGAQAVCRLPLRRHSVISAVVNAVAQARHTPEPVAAIQTKQSGDNSASSRQAVRSALRVLLAEDNLVNRRVVGFMLGSIVAQIDVAVDGVEAVRLASAGSYGLIFMDCQMPEMDGYEATRKIREYEAAQHLPRVPILALTANAMPEDEAQCLAAGMDGFISKPVRAQTLRDAVAKYSG